MAGSTPVLRSSGKSEAALVSGGRGGGYHEAQAAASDSAASGVENMCCFDLPNAERKGGAFDSLPVARRGAV